MPCTRCVLRDARLPGFPPFARPPAPSGGDPDPIWGVPCEAPSRFAPEPLRPRSARQSRIAPASPDRWRPKIREASTRTAGTPSASTDASLLRLRGLGAGILADVAQVDRLQR